MNTLSLLLKCPFVLLFLQYEFLPMQKDVLEDLKRVKDESVNKVPPRSLQHSKVLLSFQKPNKELRLLRLSQHKVLFHEATYPLAEIFNG